MSVHNKQGLKERLDTIRATAGDVRKANSDYDTEADPVAQTRKVALLAIANATIELADEGLETIGFGAQAHLNAIFGGIEGVSSVGMVLIDGDGSVEVQQPVPALSENDSLVLGHSLLILSEIALMRLDEIARNVVAVDRSDVPGLVDAIKASLAAHDTDCARTDGDGYTQSLRRVARRLVKGAKDDLRLIGELEALAPTSGPIHIDLTDGQEGGQTLTFNIPGLNLTPVQPEVTPALRGGAIHAAEFENMLANVALGLSESRPRI